uniref:Sacsin-like n=2 Tax=Echeneis naucrates TaxID=173247 RepID=A0A665XAU0_ECHNA
MLINMDDQFQPFRDIVSVVGLKEWSEIVLEDQKFNGTIFRFPLRNEASEISDNLYDSNKVVELFDSFIADADLSLLFLKNVTSVSLIHVNAKGNPKTKLKLKSSVPSNVILGPEDKSIIEGATRFKVISLNSDTHRETKWLVTTCILKEGNVESLDSLAEKLCFFPQVDLAFPCGERRECSESRLSCFLPLPNNESNKTGLPVCVNACFGLTDNRRHIKWQEEDQRHDEHALWNELLMKEVLPQAYLMIIQDAIKLAQKSLLPVASVYDLWPDIEQVQHKEKWYAVALDVLQKLFKENIAVLSLDKDERKFIVPSQAVFPCNGPTGTDVLAAIQRTLVSCGENLVTLPGSATRAIKEAYPNFSALKHVTPTFLRTILRRIGVHNISKDDRLCLLEYIMSDGEYAELKGLQLLPLDDGSFRSFSDRDEDTVLIDSNEFPRALLPCCKHLFIPHDLRPACVNSLRDLARKKLYKVINVDADKVAEYTRRYLPQDWKQTRAGLVTWDTGNSQHPPLHWLQDFWKFLNTHFKELSRFIGIPLIPVSPLSASQAVTLAQLQQNTTLIFRQNKQTSLPDQVAQLVNNAGGTVVKGNEWLKHIDLDSHVLSPSPRSVMKVMMNLDLQHLIQELKKASHRAREEVKGYLFHLDSLSACEKDLLSKLPLFQTMKGSCVAAQSKQAVLLNSGLTVPTELPMPDSVVQCATDVDRRLLQLLQIKLLDTAEAANLLVDSVQKRSCSKEDTEKIMTWIIQHGNILFSQNQTLKRRCKDLSFIEVNGELRKASSFFDPRIEAFKVIFESGFFPPHQYTRTEQMLQSLTELGLLNKEGDVSPQHLLLAASLIDKLHDSCQAEALKRAQVLLKMLDANNLLSNFSQNQLEQLRKLKWVPCHRPGSDKSQELGFFCPNEIRHPMFKDIVRHVMPLMGKLNVTNSNTLGLRRQPSPEKVTENLFVLISEAQKMVAPDTDVDFKRELHSIYRHMQDHISEFKKVIDMDTPWLWNNRQFVPPKDLILDYPSNLDLSSYIGKVPNEFLPYKKLLCDFGLKTLLSEGEIIGILLSIQNSIEQRRPPYASSSEVKVSIEILNWLWKAKKTVQDDIPVPVILKGDTYTLKPRSTTVFCDLSKNGLKELQCSQEEIHIIHEEIPKATAEWLNIPFLSTYILSPELVGLEQCGQSEPITMRIKNILKEYDEESDIFKELIQNSEDAGAKTCKFMLDFRKHKDAPESLIDPDMALCQGPCLWAFNDEQFTAEDWQNIVRVGAASKENKVEKIGKFGLGFNTVYHVTDIPSILSGNSLLVLDPNVTHLKKHIKHKTNPGIKLDLSQQRILNCFSGHFRPYERIFDCNFSRQPYQPYQGTLIKLPFRTEKEAANSELSSKVFHKPDIIAFQQHLTKNSQTHLLFLKNVSALSLQSIPNGASSPPKDEEKETVFTVTKVVDRKLTIPDGTSVSKQQHAEKFLMNLDRRCKEVIDSSTVRVVHITSQQSDVTEVQSWLLYNCFGTQKSLQMALEGNKQAKFSLPIGGVAIPLKNYPQTGKLAPLKTDLVGQAFCFLPLSIHTGLPVNVNGTFAVTSNRKGLWESGVKHDWNKALLQDPVVTAYVTTLLVLKKMSENKQMETYSYHTFWPDRDKVSDTFKPLADAFYSAIAQPSAAPELFSDGEHWCSMNTAIFLHESIEKDKNVSALVVQVCKTYIKPPHHVVPLPQWLRNSFKKAGLQNVLQARTWTWEKFYQEVVFNNIGTMDPMSRDTLVLHAIDLHIEEIDNLLVNYPCIPTTGGQLQCIKNLVNPTGKVACLFEPEDGCLLGGTKNDFCSCKRIKRLLELGMASDCLPLKDITRKASTINKIWSTDRKKAYGQLKCLLELMKDHMHEENSAHWQTLRTTEFLPAFSPGDTKMERNVTLKRPTDVFRDKCSLLVNMTRPVLDPNLKMHNSDSVLQILQVCNSPSHEIVLQQLEETWKHSQTIDKLMLHRIAYECYRFLDEWLRESGNPTYISQRAKSFPFILVGSTFINVDCVAESEAFEAKPYLHVLPPGLSSFRTLWESVGIEKNFTVSQFLNVLQDLRRQHGSRPLPKSDLSMCLMIVNKGLQDAKEKVPSDCVIPNQHGALQLTSELFFNDSPWMPVAPEVSLCHEKIPRVTARHLGIKTTRHHTLQNHIANNISPFTFQFEQQEQLTVRIKNIISAYPSKKDILKELIQNADDAEATEIHFIWDKRQHNKEKTFGKRWNYLQGPALCVFNNKVFSNDDLAGIQQLGEGGKHNTPGKIGKYGVGFNSVYHVTDCPSILTGDELLCISDPNQKYLESHSDKPLSGIGYRLQDTFKNMYMDVYKTFLPDEFSLKDGTMFRLPLRMGTMANSSKISQQAVTDLDMKELCSALSEDPEGLILFLKNICKIHVHEINEHTEKLKTIFVVEKTLPKTSREEKDAFERLLENALQANHQIEPKKATYGTVILTSDKRESKWIIAEQFGSFKNSDTRQKTITTKLPQAAVAACVRKKGCSDFHGVAFCSLPLPGTTGLPVHINANFEVDSSRKNLWKEDGQSLKTEWNESLKQSVIAPLYADLLHYISCNLPKTRGHLTDIESGLCDSYLCFWPVVSKDVDQSWHEMIHEVYRSIKDRGFNVIPVMKSSVRMAAGRTLTEHSFDWCNITETHPTKAPHLANVKYKLNSILEDLGMKLVPSSSKMEQIWTSFKSAGVELKRVSPSTVQTFLKEAPLNDPKQTDEALPLPIASTLIRDEKRCSFLLGFCLQDLFFKKVTQTNLTLLNGLPLLLTRGKVLTTFSSECPKWVSVHERLFIGYEDKFADFETNRKYLEVLETYNLVKNLTVPCSVSYLKPLIHHHLKSCKVDEDTGLYVPSKTMMEWLIKLWRFLTSQIKTSSADKEGLTFSDVMQPFGDCYILPVVCPRSNNKHLLERIKHMPSVLQVASKRDISGILFKLGFMMLNNVFFVEMLVHRHLTFSELMDVNDNASVLDQVSKINHSEFSQLSMDEMNELQTSLMSGISRADNKEDYQRKLKSLPLFETIHGQRVRIDGPEGVFLLNSTYARTFPDIYNLSNCKSTFLKNTPQNVNLPKTLDIKSLTDLEYFMKFILPDVHNLTEMQMLNCIKLVLALQHTSDYPAHKDNIISVMKDVKMIRSSNGRLETASYFYDKEVQLYQKMLPEERFVPKRFWDDISTDHVVQTDQIKELLKNLGMKHTVSKDEIVNFAHQLESEAKRNGHLQELKEKSKLLFSEALNKEMLRSIAHIKFVYPVAVRKELCNYHQPFAPEGTPVSITGSLIENSYQPQQDLIWTSMPIIRLPNNYNQNPKKLMKDAGAYDKLPTQFVTSNMRNICQSPCVNAKLIETRSKVFRHSYAYLRDNEFDEKPLAGLPIVLVENDTKLVKTDDVCIALHCEQDFRPYLFRIPEDDVVFLPFFKKNGVKDQPTAEHYCNVLSAVHADSCDKLQLNPNQMKTVKRAVQHLFLLIKAQEKQSPVAEVKMLYLPAADGKLHPSSSLYYNDTAFESRRLEALKNKFLLLQRLSECHLGSDVYKHHQLVKMLPQHLIPKMLSQVTQEKVVEFSLEGCELVPDCEFSGWFDRHLSSVPFRHGLICLIRHQSQGEITHENALDMCQKIFGRIQIICCKSLEAELWLNGQPVNKTASEIDVFVTRNHQGCIFYLKHNDDMALKVINEVNMTLTKEINALLNNTIAADHLTVLGQLIMCDNLQDVQKALAKNGIRDSAQTESVFKLPVPGTEIPAGWHDCLDMDMLNNFEEGEYVGYSIGNKYVYAVIADKLPGNRGQYSQRYKIDIGEDEPVEVSCLDLFQFKREKKAKPNGPTFTSAESSCLELELVAGPTPHSSQSSAAGSTSSSTRSQPATVEEAKMEIDRCLEEIWTLLADERNKAIKRLYLRWHPDKNPDCQFLATEAFKYLQKRIEDYTNGRGKSASSSSPRKNSHFRDFYEQWNEEARYHRSSRERFSRGFSSYNFWNHHQNVPRPNKEEAQRWCRQARCDLNAASKDIGGGSTEWCLFKVHQAVEKSLIAAAYKKNGQRPDSTSISSIAAIVCRGNPQLRVLPQIVQDLKTLGVDAKKTQYPNCHPFPHIPNEQFRSENERQAVAKASELLSKVEDYVN